MSTTATDTAAEILASFALSFGAIFDRIGWAEDEIAQAVTRHPEQADAIYHSFSLLSGGDAAERMSVEAVYRAHAREILERVARGQDTRPGTAVEVVIGLLAAAERAPLSQRGVRPVRAPVGRCGPAGSRRVHREAGTHRGAARLAHRRRGSRRPPRMPERRPQARAHRVRRLAPRPAGALHLRRVSGERPADPIRRGAPPPRRSIVGPHP